MLPAISAGKLKILGQYFLNGKTAAGWAKVNGIVCWRLKTGWSSEDSLKVTSFKRSVY